MDYGQLLAATESAVREAGVLLRAAFHHPDGPQNVDRSTEELLQERLLAFFPAHWRGEELGFKPADLNEQHCWLVDPHDGTDHFLGGRRGSAVSVALLCDGRPVLGVVYAFGFPDDAGDLISGAIGCGLFRNGQAVTTKVPDMALDVYQGTFRDEQIVYVSPLAEPQPAATRQFVAPARFIGRPGIAYRLALVAAGEGVVACAVGRRAGWDYAAGHVLIELAGGIFLDGHGKTPVYTRTGESAMDSCFGGGPLATAAMVRRAGTAPRPVVNEPPVPSFLTSRKVRPVADAERLSRAQGCLLGQFAGDALGGLVEFCSVDSIARRYPDGVRNLADGGTWRNLAGQPTDDSELALMLARSLAFLGRYDPAAVVSAYCHWWKRAWDRGATISRAISAASRGLDAQERLQLARDNASHTSASNGSLMRISPLGIFYAGRSDEAAAAARLESQSTHPNPQCVDSCGVFVAAIAHTIAAGDGPRAAYEVALRHATEPRVRQALLDAAKAPPADYETQMGYVIIALQNAFYQLLHAPNLEEGIIQTVQSGGDTDTTGAIAGALLGAVYGREAIPARWRRAVLCCRTLPEAGTAHPMPAEYWPVDALQLAEVLLSQ